MWIILLLLIAVIISYPFTLTELSGILAKLYSSLYRKLPVIPGLGWWVFSFLKCDMSGGPYRVAQKREDAVSKEVTRKLSEADNRKMSRKEKDERWSLCPLPSLPCCKSAFSVCEALGGAVGTVLGAVFLCSGEQQLQGSSWFSFKPFRAELSRAGLRCTEC